MSASYYLTAVFDNCIPRQQFDGCNITRPFLSLQRVWLTRLVKTLAGSFAPISNLADWLLSGIIWSSQKLLYNFIQNEESLFGWPLMGLLTALAKWLLLIIVSNHWTGLDYWIYFVGITVPPSNQICWIPALFCYKLHFVIHYMVENVQRTWMDVCHEFMGYPQ